jgi:hypothetical protein
LGIEADIQMKFLLKTQLVALGFAFFWVMYLTIIAFFDQPGRALQNINSFVYGFAILFGIIYIGISMFSLDRKWFSLPLVLIPNIFIYQSLFLRVIYSLSSKGFAGVVHFLSLSTGFINLLTATMGLLIGIMVTRPKRGPADKTRLSLLRKSGVFKVF